MKENWRATSHSIPRSLHLSQLSYHAVLFSETVFLSIIGKDVGPVKTKTILAHGKTLVHCFF